MGENEIIAQGIEWVPKTELGKRVLKGEFDSINYILSQNLVIKEPEIVDFLLPDLEEEMIFLGKTPGKGGGGRRIVVKKTVRMHKSGRRIRVKAMAIVGNKKGVVGLGEGDGKEARAAMVKAINNAKLNVTEIPRGCGSWECSCKEEHSIPIKTKGKCSSVTVELIPAPKGLGLCANDEVKKILQLAGIRDIWMKSRGNTGSRDNLIKATFYALKNIKKFMV